MISDHRYQLIVIATREILITWLQAAEEEGEDSGTESDDETETEPLEENSEACSKFSLMAVLVIIKDDDDERTRVMARMMKSRPLWWHLMMILMITWRKPNCANDEVDGCYPIRDLLGIFPPIQVDLMLQ